MGLGYNHKHLPTKDILTKSYLVIKFYYVMFYCRN